jgi:hypothetical protein
MHIVGYLYEDYHDARSLEYKVLRKLYFSRRENPTAYNASVCVCYLATLNKYSAVSRPTESAATAHDEFYCIVSKY